MGTIIAIILISFFSLLFSILSFVNELVGLGFIFLLIAIIVIFMLSSSLSSVSIEEKEKLEKEYIDNYNSWNCSQKERYKKENDDSIKKINKMKEFSRSQMREGLKMQRSSGPQSDWAIAGGIASALGGTAAGISVAVDTMKKNEEATERYHQKGRDLYNASAEYLHTLNELENQKTSKSLFRGYVCSNEMPELINKLTPHLDSIENVKKGFLRASIRITASRNFNYFGTDSKAIIDGSVCVELYEEGCSTLIATGYLSAPCSGSEKKDTGFGKRKPFDVLLKKEEGASFKSYRDYEIKLSNPHLWFLKV